MAGESSHHGSGSESVLSRVSHDGAVTVVAEEEVGATGGRWYFSRKEIEDNSPSRLDGIDLKKETTLRKSYCSFLQDLGMKLKVPQVTIATSIVFCHRFFICQSHAKNDRRTIATVCMFLAGKVEETPRPLKDVIIVSYEIIHKKDPSAAQRIKQKEVYEQQKELILLGERVVLATLGFELNVHHPYKPLVDAIKKFRVAQNALAQVAWNFVNDGLRTSLCLQFKPHHIAAGAIFLAAKFLKVKLPSDGERVWWQEFDVTPRQLEEVSNQMLELYEQNRVPASQGSGVEGNARAPSKTPAMNEEHASKQTSSRSGPERSYVNHGLSSRTAQNQRNDNSSAETDSVITDHKVEGETRDNEQVQHVVNKDNSRELPNRLISGVGRKGEEDRERNKGSSADVEASEWNDDVVSCKSSNAAGRNLIIDKDKVKAAIEKRKKSRGEAAWKKDVIEEEYLIEELENGVELAGDDGQIKQDKRRALSKIENQDDTKDDGEIIDGNHVGVKGQSTRGLKAENGEEGEMFNAASPLLISRKRENYSPAESSPEEKRWKSDTKFQS